MSAAGSPRGVHLRVPATSANLGPGFDALGLALTLYDNVEIEWAGSGLSIEVTGEGEETAARGEEHLIVRTFRTAYRLIGAGATTTGTAAGTAARPGRADTGATADAGDSGAEEAGETAAGHGARAAQGVNDFSATSEGAGDSGAGVRPAAGPDRHGGGPAGLRVRCVNRIPHARGLGSSSAATVAGILAARALHPRGDAFTDDDVLALATRIEGHPDNVAPCLAGGLTIAWDAGAGPRLTRLDVDPRVRPVALVPEHRLATEQARGLLPPTVPHGDAAANAGRAALLIAALTGRPELLLDATEDRLHQAYRAPAMPESAALVGRLRAKRVPAVVSGAGPTVLALPADGEADSIGSEVGTSWHIHPLNVDPHGACVRPID